MTIPADSALWAHGRLSPYAATRFNVQEAHHAAYLALGNDDSFVFAYRAIEDLARAVSPTHKTSWAALHAHLGVSERQLKTRVRRLLAARNAVVHGDVNDPALAAARADATRTIGGARKLVRQAFVNEPTLPAI